MTTAKWTINTFTWELIKVFIKHLGRPRAIFSLPWHYLGSFDTNYIIFRNVQILKNIKLFFKKKNIFFGERK
jgi:hypothetical protein